jgi:hypothetical protein
MAPSMAPSITEPEAKGPSVSYAEQVAAAKALAATSLDGALQNLLSHEKTARLVCACAARPQPCDRCTPPVGFRPAVMR